MASSYRRVASHNWMPYRFRYADQSGLRAGLIVSLPISIGLWAAIFAMIRVI